MLCLSLLLLTVPFVLPSSPTPSSRGKWKVQGADGKDCILMNAQIDMQLDYFKRYPDGALETAHVSVPADASTEGSSCDVAVSIGGDSVASQVIQLNFPHNAGWNVRLAFTRDLRLSVDDDEFALFQVNITANYSSMADVFSLDGSDVRTHVYYQPIDLNTPPEIAENFYSPLSRSFYCPSQQAFVVNSDEHIGPAALIRFEAVHMQAFMDGTSFDERFTCPSDQKADDKLPIIVAAALAALVIFTLVIYIIYRSRLPPEIINLTVQEFEDERKALDVKHLEEGGHANRF